MTNWDKMRNDPEAFREWQMQRRHEDALRWAFYLRVTQHRPPEQSADTEHHAAQGSHYDRNGWGK